MSRSIGKQLPSDLFDHISARPSDEVVPIVTVDTDGLPRPALLSFREITVAAPDAFDVTLYENTRTVANLKDRGQIAMIFVYDGAAYYVRGTASSTQQPPTPGTETFAVQIVEVLEDRDPRAEVMPMKVRWT